MKKIRNAVLMGAVLLIAIIFTAACAKKVDEIEKKQTSENTMDYNYLVLVNKEIKLPSDYEKNVELATAKDVHGDDIKVEKNALEAFKQLQKSLLEEDGIDIELDSVYRSVQDQQDLWDEWANDPEKGIDYVLKFMAVPGYSEHHTGLAIDVCLVKDGKIIDDNDEMIAEKEIFAKVHEKLSDYGFILRYPEGREADTGYTYEPWHFRYVGDPSLAWVITNENLTLEEYIATLDDVKGIPSAARYKIVEALKKELKEAYKDKYTEVKFDVTKIYGDDEAKDLVDNYSSEDILFEVEYQIKPSEGVDPNEFMIPNGELDSETGWVKKITRVGTLKYNSKDGSYSLSNFGTGF